MLDGRGGGRYLRLRFGLCLGRFHRNDDGALGDGVAIQIRDDVVCGADGLAALIRGIDGIGVNEMHVANTSTVGCFDNAVDDIDRAGNAAVCAIHHGQDGSGVAFCRHAAACDGDGRRREAIFGESEDTIRMSVHVWVNYDNVAIGDGR